MSYSYIKTVFPDFNKTSNKIYDDSLYDINITENKKQEIPKTVVKNKEFELPYQLTSNTVDVPLNNLLESYENANITLPYTPNDNKTKNNLQFYNQPINKEYLKPESVKSNISYISSIPVEMSHIQTKSDKTNSTRCDFDCDIYTKHILECSTCKDIFIKQFGLENDKIRNEEIMEIISYFIFALFILLLVDALKK